MSLAEIMRDFIKIEPGISVSSVLGVDDKKTKLTDEQLDDFVNMVACLKKNGLHQKSGEYKTAWSSISEALRERYDIDCSVEYLRSQWHHRLKVTRKRFYAVTDSLHESGKPITEDLVDAELLKTGGLCKPCDSIIYCHFRKHWIEQKQQSILFKELMGDALMNNTKEDDDGMCGMSDNAGLITHNGEEGDKPNEELQRLLMSYASSVTNKNNKDDTLATSLESPPSGIKLPDRKRGGEENCNTTEPKNFVPPPPPKRRKEEEDNKVESVLSSIADSLRVLAAAAVRQAAASENISTALKLFVNNNKNVE